MTRAKSVSVRSRGIARHVVRPALRVANVVNTESGSTEPIGLTAAVAGTSMTRGYGEHGCGAGHPEMVRCNVCAWGGRVPLPGAGARSAARNDSRVTLEEVVGSLDHTVGVAHLPSPTR